MSKDTIYRQDAIDTMAELQGRASSKGELIGISKAWKRIKKLPSAEPRKGKWLLAGRTTHYNVCSLCNGVGDTTMKYCPNCGADMRGEQDE